VEPGSGWPGSNAGLTDYLWHTQLYTLQILQVLPLFS